MTRHPRLGRRTILLVDGEPELRTLIGLILRDHDYRIVAVARHSEAIALLRAFRFSLILADAEPDTAAGVIDQWSSLERLLAAAGDTPVVVCTAHDPLLFTDHAARGFAGLLPQPFELETLLDTVRRSLAPCAG